MTDVIIPLIMSKGQIRNNFANDANYLLSSVKGSSEDIIYNTVKGDEMLVFFLYHFKYVILVIFIPNYSLPYSLSLFLLLKAFFPNKTPPIFMFCLCVTQ